MTSWFVVKLISFFIFGVASELKVPISSLTNKLDDKIALEVLRVSPVNTIVSPILLKFPLCKLSSVARGLAKFELMAAFGFSTEDRTAKCYTKFRRHLSIMRQQDFLMTNKIYLNESLDVDPNFIENSTELFGVRVDKVGFKYSMAASQFMNRAIERDMLKRVTNIIEPEDININTSMVILNAASLKVTWERPFYPQLTKEKTFRNMKGKLFKTPMIVTLDSFLYLEDPNFDVKIITMPLIQDDITFVMPSTNNGLPSFFEKMYNDKSVIKKLRDRMKRVDVTISIPKFKIKTYVDWTGFLRLVGINMIMNTTSSGLHRVLKTNSTNKVYLSKAKQKIFLELDEFGSKRYAMTEQPKEFKRMVHFMDKGLEMVLDKPFYFFISFREKYGEHDLFHGAYYGPQEI